MKASIITNNNNSFVTNDKMPGGLHIIREQTYWNFNAAAGLIILFAIFTIVLLFFILILDVIALETDLLPAAIAVVLSAVTAIIIFTLSHISEIITKLLNGFIIKKQE